MTENKRFTITQDFEEHHRQIRDNGYILMGCFVEPQAKVIVDLLNQLNDENEQLKKKIEYYKEAKQEYKADWKYASARAEKYEDKCDSLQDENEELEQIIKEAYNILQEANLFSNKATNLDIYAYSEMLKMDNKDAYAIATGIKEALKILKEMIE